MDERSYCQLMARYNEWMNLRLFALLATRPESELHRERGAFFKSVYMTLNHIAYGDLAFLSRATGAPREVPELNVDLFGSFHALRVERETIDSRLLRWADAVSPASLASTITYASNVDGVERTVPRWVLAVHMFNHQAHHRGQLLTLLSQMGLDMGPTDIPFMPQFRSIEPAA